MTEAEWLACENALAMVELALTSARASDRAHRLFVAAFWGWHATHLAKGPGADLRRRAEAMERLAEKGTLPKGFRMSPSPNVVFFNRNAAFSVTHTVHSPPQWEVPNPKAAPMQAALLREVFGNPFRPVAPEPSWLTSDVLALARGIYEEKAFDRMPILADALQDAGCANEDVLNHCRSEQTHVRGCWVLDLLLGKQ
jgi:hypothetical protein